jgi:hypothetical protein
MGALLENGFSIWSTNITTRITSNFSDPIFFIYHVPYISVLRDRVSAYPQPGTALLGSGS